MVRGSIKLAATLSITGGAFAYILWKIDLEQTGHVLAHARLPYFLLAVVATLTVVWPFAWRWRTLLRARGVDEPMRWLVRAYFVSFAAQQIFPTALGGDATRIFELRRRHPDQGGVAAATVILERALGGMATMALAAVGFVLAIGRYPVGGYIVVEGVFVVLTVAGGFVLFSKRLRRPLRRFVPLLRQMKIERPLRAVYEGMHGYGAHAGLIARMSLLTTFVQAFRILGIWLCAKSVGVDLSPRPFYVMGPMLFLVMLVPFTVNGFAVREAFFVSFLANLHVPADEGFATGLLYFCVSMSLALPGVLILAWGALRPKPALGRIAAP
jgi:uncharacterized protein (TIRG00374 family)